VYEIIGTEANSYRIVYDEYEPYLYALRLFEIIDLSTPTFWVKEYAEIENFTYILLLGTIIIFLKVILIMYKKKLMRFGLNAKD